MIKELPFCVFVCLAVIQTVAVHVSSSPFFELFPVQSAMQPKDLISLDSALEISFSEKKIGRKERERDFNPHSFFFCLSHIDAGHSPTAQSQSNPLKFFPLFFLLLKREGTGGGRLE